MNERMEAARHGHPNDFVFRMRMPDGSIKHLRSFTHGARMQNGRLELIGSVLDITESKLAEAALATREAELRQAYDYLTEAQRLSKTGSFTWDVFGDRHNWSEEIRRIFGFGPDVPVTMPMIQAAVHPDDMDEVERVIGGAAEGRNFDLVFRIHTTEGEVRYAHVVGHRIEDLGERPVFLGALQDVTASKLAEEALKASEAELRRANNYLTIAQKLSKTGSWIWDLGKDERQWSEEMYRIFEVNRDTTAPSALTRELVHPDDYPVVEALMQHSRQGRDYDSEFRLVMPTGTVKTLRVVGHLVGQSQDGPVFIGAAQDITDRKMAEEGLDRARRELAHVSRVTALSALTASIAHEVNQPLAGIVTNTSTCLRMLAAEPPNVEGAMATVQRTARDANRAAEVIRRLRGLFARRPPGAEPVDLNDAVREVLVLSSGEVQGARVVL